MSNEKLDLLIKQVPNYRVMEKCLWSGDTRVEIDHIDNDLDKPLDYITAFEKMIIKLDKRTEED